MVPPLSSTQEAILKKIYYQDKFFMGRDKLFAYLQEKYPDGHPSRRQVMAWLKNQETYQINFQPKVDTGSRSFIQKKQGYIQIDLIDMSSNPERGFYWVLTAVDVFSKKAAAFPLKSKSQSSTIKVMRKLLDVFPKISVIQSDNGPEFSQPDFYQANNIKHITSKSYTPQTQGIVERWNGSLKRMIALLQTSTGKRQWIDSLPDLVANYNASIHATTKKKPNSVTQNDNETADLLQKRENTNPIKSRLNKLEQQIQVGSKVRVKLQKGALDKKNARNFTTELYTVTQLIKPKRPFELTQYRLKDSDGDVIRGLYNVSSLIPASFDFSNKIL